MTRVLVLLFAWGLVTSAAAGDLRLAVTTSFQNSGLADVVIPAAERDLEIEIDVLVAGSGQALRLGAAGDVDAVLVHAPDAERAFVAAGHAPYRREIMYNTFVVVGPSSDPANVAATATAAEALIAVAETESAFVSRGDESGTHVREKMVWNLADLRPQGRWYRSVGAGMGAALNIAASMDAYVLTDRASWANFANKRDLQVLFSGDPILINQYSYLPTTTARSDVGRQLARRLEAWLISETGQATIGSLRIEGRSLFVPNASGVMPEATRAQVE